MTHDFEPKDLDKIKEICYSMNIKYYTISMNDKEIMEYGELSKRHN